MNTEYELSDQVRVLLARAEAEALQSGHTDVGTGHILLALLAVASDSLAIKSLPDHLEYIVRLHLGAGSNSSGKVGWSEEAIGLVNESVVQYGDPEDETTSRCEQSLLIERLMLKANFFRQAKERGESVKPVHGHDCALESLSQAVADLHLICGFAMYEHNHSINDALGRLSFRNQLIFLTRVFQEQAIEDSPYSDPDELFRTVESLAARCRKSIKQSKEEIERNAVQMRECRVDYEKHQAALAGVKDRLKELEQGLSYLGAVCEPEAPIDPARKLLLEQKDVAQVRSNELTEKIKLVSDRFYSAKGEAERLEEDSLKLQEHVDALDKLLQGHRKSMKSARISARNALLRQMEKLTEGGDTNGN